jgi:hypothetical protein
VAFLLLLLPSSLVSLIQHSFQHHHAFHEEVMGQDSSKDK